MPGQHLDYAVEKHGDGWYWELKGERGQIITQGFADSEVKARASAFAAGSGSSAVFSEALKLKRIPNS